MVDSDTAPTAGGPRGSPARSPCLRPVGRSAFPPPPRTSTAADRCPRLPVASSSYSCSPAPPCAPGWGSGSSSGSRSGARPTASRPKRGRRGRDAAEKEESGGATGQSAGRGGGAVRRRERDRSAGNDLPGCARCDRRDTAAGRGDGHGGCSSPAGSCRHPMPSRSGRTRWASRARCGCAGWRCRSIRGEGRPLERNGQTTWATLDRARRSGAACLTHSIPSSSGNRPTPSLPRTAAPARAALARRRPASQLRGTVVPVRHDGGRVRGRWSWRGGDHEAVAARRRRAPRWSGWRAGAPSAAAGPPIPVWLQHPQQVLARELPRSASLHPRRISSAKSAGKVDTSSSPTGV